MAQTTYTTTTAVTLATRRIAYQRIAELFMHLDAFNLNVLAIVLNADHTVSITLNNPLPAGQLQHLGVA